MPNILKSPSVAPTAKFWSQGVKSGDTIYVSGQVAMDKNGKVVGNGDMRAQTRMVLENIKAVLSEGGATMDDVVKVTMFVTDMSKADQAREIRMEYFTKNPPASTGVEVNGLVHPDLMIEIEAIAVVKRRPGGRRGSRTVRARRDPQRKGGE